MFFIDGESEICLEAIVIFATGAVQVLPLGFDPQPTIEFPNDTKYPLVNTCCNLLTIAWGNKDFKLPWIWCYINLRCFSLNKHQS